MAATRDEVVPAIAAADRMTLRVIDSMYTLMLLKKINVME